MTGKIGPIDLAKQIADLLKMQSYHSIFPSYITHIRFPRYKNLMAGAHITFDFPITALVGANGSGKTSVLNALYGAPLRQSTGQYWFSTVVDPIEEGEGSPNRFIYGHFNTTVKQVVETRKARVRKTRNGREDPNYWEPTKESPGDGMEAASIPDHKAVPGRSQDRWNPVARDVLYINFRRELSAFDKYFYFGKEPVVSVSGDKPTGRGRPKILSKQDQIMYDSTLLARVIQTGDTSATYRNLKIATENRLLTKEELTAVSFVLGRDYSEARWIRHRLFKGDGGLSIVFKTKHAQYSEAFAGSGEVAVASCVVQVLKAKEGALVLLDEPEVSLHPGAQERLLGFLAKMAKERKIQVVFSTHSPHLVSALPDQAIKTFVQMPNGEFSIIQSTHPYAAFRHLGARKGKEVTVFVEDFLAQEVVKQALRFIDDEVERELFHVEYLGGGADTFLTQRIPVWMETANRVLVILDGDKRRVEKFVDPKDIPEAQNPSLEDVICSQVGTRPSLSVDGHAGSGNSAQKTLARRRYLEWINNNLKYLPMGSPEEIILDACGKLPEDASRSSGDCEAQLRQVAEEQMGRQLTASEVDRHGAFLLGLHFKSSQPLRQLTQVLREYLKMVRPE